GGLADELGLRVGDEIAEINGDKVADIIDYRFFISDEQIKLGFFRDMKKQFIEFDKEPDEPLGAEFADFEYKACGDDCVFCFVDQNPEGLRKGLYFRDGDFRLSFLYGNYTTLTNLGPNSLRRIVRQRLTPMYISVHSTVPEVRMKLMGHQKDDMMMPKMKYLAENGIEMHTQIVLCPGLNDGQSLIRTVSELYELSDAILSVSIVPVGITAHRKGLEELRQLDAEYARMLIKQLSVFQNQFRKAIGRGFLYLSDEIYMTAGVPLPDAYAYDGFPLTENGVGMVSQFLADFDEQSQHFKKRFRSKRKLTLATSALPQHLMRERVVSRLNAIGNLAAELVVCPNTLYGEVTTVSGLLSGNCFYKALKGRDLGDMLLLPKDSVNFDGKFLDDTSPSDLSQKLGGVPVAIFGGDWNDVLKRLT
ncbi:MAG: DUF512 domain-containing protein, partial [Rhizobacter sp.]|nr:DUF512 domain-containing protein [Chlorobiales bacterium]